MKCCLSNAKKLNTPVTVECHKKNATVDGSGNINEKLDSNWTQCGKEWVEIITKGSREFFRDRQIGEDITHQITMRYSKRASGYTNLMRLRLDGRKLHIANPPVNVDENNEWLVFECVETPVL